MQPELDVLRQRFQQLAARIKAVSQGREIIYIPNKGNFGDGLIRYGTKLFFADFEIKHTEVHLNLRSAQWLIVLLLLKQMFQKRYYFIYGGGGSFGIIHGSSLRYFRILQLFTDDVMVLPSTYEFRLPKGQAICYARDKFQSISLNPNAIFCDDMAFYVLCSEIRQNFLHIKPTTKLGLLLRGDKESNLESAQFEENFDLSETGDHMSCGDQFISKVAKYETVFTDRLHVAIAGVICGRPVFVAAGKTWKTESIVRSSIEPLNANVRFYADGKEFLDKYRELRASVP